MTTARPHPRIEAVIEETLAILNEEIRAGRITSDKAVDKVQHLVNTVRKYATGQAPERRRQSDWEQVPTASSVDVVNLINLPPIQAPTQELNVDFRPSILFVNLACGRVNLNQIAFLDRESKKMHLVGGLSKSLSDSDFQKIAWWADRFQVS